jgi:hypothetical protein
VGELSSVAQGLCDYLEMSFPAPTIIFLFHAGEQGALVKEVVN